MTRFLLLLSLLTFAFSNEYMPRPGYNAAGVGFYVVNNKLYDANGNQFIIRGMNRCHYDSCFSTSLNNTRANTMRWIIYFNETSHMLDLLQQQNIAEHIVAIPGNWDGTCKEDTSVMDEMVNTWVTQYAQWHTIERYLIINIANEWGPSNSTVWRDAYTSAIGKLRAAGYTTTIQVTSGGCGQDNEDIVRYGRDVLNSDPLKNVLFDQHIYGNWCDPSSGCANWQTQLATGLSNLNSTGLAVIVGEFGPGRNIGPSPTLLTPQQIISGAEKYGFGWMAWAWDDPGCYGCNSAASCDNTFTLSWDGNYTSTNDLTTFGKQVIEDPTWGTKVLAKQASIFG
jgi:mannan endo-1,4-beta-mannosidase